MNENYDFADLSGRYYAREMEFEKTKKKFLKVIRELLLDINYNVRNPPIDSKTYRCPVHGLNWFINYHKDKFRYPDYIWNMVCPDCFDKFSKLDTTEMIELFPILKGILDKKS